MKYSYGSGMFFESENITQKGRNDLRSFRQGVSEAKVDGGLYFGIHKL